VRYLEANRDFALEFVNERLHGVRAARPEGTYLLWLDCRQAGIPGNPQRFFLERARVALNDVPTMARVARAFCASILAARVQPWWSTGADGGGPCLPAGRPVDDRARTVS